MRTACGERWPGCAGAFGRGCTRGRFGNRPRLRRAGTFYAGAQVQYSGSPAENG